MTNPALNIENLSVEFASSAPRGVFEAPSTFRALNNITLSVNPGEVLGLIGESGSGKTTLGKAIVGLVEQSSGSLVVNGEALDATKPSDRRKLARQVQMVFQDPYSSLHPRKTVGYTLAEPFRIQKTAERSNEMDLVQALLERVGLNPQHAARFPQHFSGGQRQRIAIARAIANSPSIIVADEPVSALDVSVQAQILNLLDELRTQENMAMLFISHDLSVVRHLCQRIAVMYLGEIVETGPSKALSANPRHPYTAALMSAVPRVKAKNKARSKPIVLKGDVPSHDAIPCGCPFHTRCWLYEQKGRPARCRSEIPKLVEQAEDRQSACFFPEDVAVSAEGA
ncbi:ABC transporter ATP-binding protein [Ruegeria atlantica]|uniref:ABC transporter ATP-binding protein n=1 Tax=Ruegeria atlantica TaxID=81569 RepID=UPI00147AF636|nr:oligopeptide/dipeptide ABC transporter ATP-binding protein [Ruegeria atlantica]